MKKITSRLFSFAIFTLFAAAVTIAAPSQPAQPQIFFTHIKGTINPASAAHFKRTIDEANSANAEAVVFQLDTPGGLVSSVREMTQAMDQSKVPVVVYTAPAGAAATSAGALLMLGSHLAAMAPGSNIGAAHPIDSSGADIKGKAAEKAENDVAAMARGLAEVRGRNTLVAEQIVTKSKSFTADEAHQQGVVEILAPNLDALFHLMNGRIVKVGGEMKTLHTDGVILQLVEMTFGQKVLNFLAHPNVAGMLMSLGAVLIYVEMSTPGVLIPGILGGICIIISLISFELLPIRSGGLILLLSGVVMLLLEPFVISHGALAGGGIVAFVLGMIWILDPASTGLHVSMWVWLPAALLLGSVVGLIGFAAARIKRQAAKALSDMGGGTMEGLSGYVGKVESLDTPTSGKALIRGELWNIESTQDLKVGDSVEVLSTQGFVAKVQKKS